MLEAEKSTFQTSRAPTADALTPTLQVYENRFKTLAPAGVEDLVMVLALVLLPALAGVLGGTPPAGEHAAGTGSVGLDLLITLGKVVLFVAVMFAVFRYGQLGAACVVIAYAVAGTVVSLGGYSPAPYLDLDPSAAVLVLQGQMLLMLATALPLAAMLLTRDRLEQGLMSTNDELRSHLTILNLTKTLAGIGRWQYNFETGAQNWSEKMLELNGLSPDLAPDPGDIRHLLPDGGARLFGKLAE